MSPGRLPWPPAVRAIVWMDAVLLVAAAFAVANPHAVLAFNIGAWTWTALAGSTLTAGLAALAAFELSAGRRKAWAWLPVPAMALWFAASGLDCALIPDGTHPWGSTLAEAGECLRFLLAIAIPLLALMVFMLWWTAPRNSTLPMVLGALASAGAGASLLAFVHPHQASFLDLAAAHAVALVVVVIAGAAAARLPARAK